MDLLLEEVQRGTLDHALTRPADAQLLVSVRRVAVWQLVDVVLGLAVLVVALVQLDGALGVGEALAFVAMLSLGTLLVYAFWVILTSGAFWFVRMGEIHELFNGVFRVGSYPVTVYPRWLRWSLTFLVPVGFAVTVPAEALTDRLRWSTVALAVAVTAGALALARVVWRAGLRRYGSASS
jgi:ABC-2 type transport system permease protein